MKDTYVSATTFNPLEYEALLKMVEFFLPKAEKDENKKTLLEGIKEKIENRTEMYSPDKLKELIELNGLGKKLLIEIEGCKSDKYEKLSELQSKIESIHHRLAEAVIHLNSKVRLLEKPFLKMKSAQYKLNLMDSKKESFSKVKADLHYEADETQYAMISDIMSLKELVEICEITLESLGKSHMSLLQKISYYKSILNV